MFTTSCRIFTIIHPCLLNPGHFNRPLYLASLEAKSSSSKGLGLFFAPHRFSDILTALLVGCLLRFISTVSEQGSTTNPLWPSRWGHFSCYMTNKIQIHLLKHRAKRMHFMSQRTFAKIWLLFKLINLGLNLDYKLQDSAM